jgi:hypothetical protein
MFTPSGKEKRKARIGRLNQALHDMRPCRRHGDPAALKRIDRELETLRPEQWRHEKRRA